MIELTNWNIASFIFAGMGLFIGAFGVMAKIKRDRLTRLIDKETAEHARHKGA